MHNHASANLPQSAKVFISYRREDSAGHAGRLLDQISSYFGDRIKIFMDIDSIAPGEDFINVIKNAVGACEILVAIIGRNWLTITNEAGERRLDNPEDFVRVEIATALNRNIRVIPILVQGATMPRPEHLPEALVKLTRRNAIEVSDTRWKYDVGRLITTIEEVASLQPNYPEKGQSQQLAEKGRMKWLRTWPVIISVIGISILLSIGLWLLRRNLPANVNSNNSAGSNTNASTTGNTPTEDDETTRTPSPFIAQVSVFKVDDKFRGSFGIGQGVNPDGTPFYVLNYVLEEKDHEQFVQRLNFNTNVGNNPRAQKLLAEGANMAQLDLLRGPIASRAKALTSGTKSDNELEGLIRSILTTK